MAKPYPGALRFKFGDSQEISEWLIGLVLEGKKTGTCWAYRDVADGEPMLQVGDIAVYTDWDCRDVCAVEFTKIEICRFDHVPEPFALSEGEGSYDDWRRGHIQWLSRTGGWSPEMEIVCENFRVIELF